MRNPRRKCVTQCVGGRVERHHRNECNINSIMAKYRRTGLLPARVGSGMSGDFTAAVDYHSSLEAIRAAEAGFMSMPSQLRKRFDNDPAKLLDFLANDDNYDEAVALGLVPKVDKVPNKTETETESQESAGESE